MKKKNFVTPSYSSPKSGKRGCLCKDGKTYHSKCCDGSLQAQGIGKVWKYNNNQFKCNINIKSNLWNQVKS